MISPFFFQQLPLSLKFLKNLRKSKSSSLRCDQELRWPVKLIMVFNNFQQTESNMFKKITIPYLKGSKIKSTLNCFKIIRPSNSMAALWICDRCIQIVNYFLHAQMYIFIFSTFLLYLESYCHKKLSDISLTINFYIWKVS